jgi:hypothetical protein
MTARPVQESNSKNDGAVCPESTIESAIGRNSEKPPAKNSNSKLICESTIESAPRRDFIRKAAMVTAAAGVGGLILGGTGVKKSVIPSSSAAIDCTVIAGCYLNSRIDVAVNTDLCCTTLSYNNGSSLRPGLLFGGHGACVSGEGISSNRISGQDLYGLDFWTAGKKHLVIRNDGVIVADAAGQNAGTLNKCASTCIGGGGPGIVFGELISGEGIASNRSCSALNKDGLDFYTSYQRRMSVTNAGNVGIGTVTPSSTLDVNGAQHVGGNNAASGPDIYLGVLRCGLAFPCTNSLFVANNSGCVQNQFRVDAFQNVLSIIGHSNTGAKGGAALSFRTGCAGAGETERVKINPCGKVGIGTDSPTTLLDVNGTIFGTKVGVGTASPATPLQVVGTASASSLGVGTTAPKTTLQINGSLAAKVVLEVGSSTVSSYPMKASDFAVLVNASVLPSGVTTFTVTLPAAATASGMIVFIKRFDSSTTNTVTVSANTTAGDSIEAKATKILSKQFDGLHLISNGFHEWFVVGNSIGDGFTS